MIDLSIVIVSYNTKRLLIDCINSIINTTKKISYEIIVIDNASNDDTHTEISNLKSQISNLSLIKNTENVGFSKANNAGVSKSKGKYLLFLNPDTLIYNKTIDGMVNFMDENKDCGAATCFIELPNKKLDDASHRGFPTPWRALSHFSYLSKLFPQQRLFSGYNLTYLNLNKTHEVDACAGAFMLVKREAGEGINWWDESFFWYGEDIDFCFRLKQKKWKIYFVPDYKILHYKGVSGGIKQISQYLSSADKATKIKATNARFEAMRIFYQKHYQKKYPFFINSLVSAGINSRWFISKLVNKI